MKLICLEACHGVEVHGSCGSRRGWSFGGRGLCALFRDRRHVNEAWPPQSVMCRLCWVFLDGWWGGGCVRPPVRCLFLCCADAGRSSCDLLCTGLLGSVPRCCGAVFFSNYGSGFWGNLTSSACAVYCDPLASIFLLRFRRTFPGTTKVHSGQTTATIPSDAPTSPPTPGHMAAPADKRRLP